jgi:hypothetical protein
MADDVATWVARAIRNIWPSGSRSLACYGKTASDRDASRMLTPAGLICPSH